jgi:hypothetical protein
MDILLSVLVNVRNKTGRIEIQRHVMVVCMDFKSNEGIQFKAS